MAHAPEKKVALRAAYVGGLPLEAAAGKAGVPLATARRWYAQARRAGDDWERAQKACLTVAGGGTGQALDRIIAAALVRCEALLEELARADCSLERGIQAMATLGDTISKLHAANRRVSPEKTAIGERIGAAAGGALSPAEALRRVREELYGG
jgi:hypothetical protein